MALVRLGRSGRRLIIASWLVLALGSAGAVRAQDAPPAGTVSLGAALAAAERFNPELEALGWEEQAQAGRTLQEGLRPNPTLGLAVENFARFGGAGGDAEGTQATVSMSQLVELGGKRRRRAAVAGLDGRLAGWELARARLDVAATTRKRFVAALLARDRVALAARLVASARETAATVGRQLEAGASSPAERVRAEAALGQAEATAARRASEARAARGALAALWGGTASAVTAVAGSLEPLAPPPALAVLRERMGENPDLARFDTAGARADAAVGLERARRWPDVTVRLGARRFVSAETNALVAELAVPLPVFNRNQGALAEAEARAGRLRAEARAATIGGDATLAASHGELVVAYEHARELERGVLPQLRAAVARTREAYAAGSLRYVDVLDAQRGVAEVEGERLETLARYHVAAAEIARLTGGAVDEGDGR